MVYIGRTNESDVRSHVDRLADGIVPLVRAHRGFVLVETVPPRHGGICRRDVGAGLLNIALTLYFRRARPDVPWALVQEHSFSFPSGHSVFAVVSYGILVDLALPIPAPRMGARGGNCGCGNPNFRDRPQPNLSWCALSQGCCSGLLCRLHLAANRNGIRLERAADGAPTRQII